jgi:hypothetical protein
MSSTAIVKELKKQNPDTFGKLNRLTVHGWIDRTGTAACWNNAVMEWIKHGNNPGHKKGG